MATRFGGGRDTASHAHSNTRIGSRGSGGRQAVDWIGKKFVMGDGLPKIGERDALERIGEERCHSSFFGDPEM